jgi:hypothetical protein
MIPKIEPVRHESNLDTAAQTFTIKMTPQMAKLLSSQTYTDKVMAAVREPLSNAYDSQTRAGNMVPVDLHLPTPLEPWFSLRDYGTGMSHEKVLSHMFSYGESDKRDTNTEIGGFAIGAKAFYAYTDICTITSWHDGTVRRYAATKDKHGLPQGQLIDEAQTELPNGVEIRFPVNQGEYEIFKEKTARVLTFLDLPYVCNLGDGFKVNKPSVFFSTEIDGYRIDLIPHGDTKVIMGGIAYSVPSDTLWSYAKEKVGCYLENVKCHVHLPIGAMEIAASRESLSPTEEDKLFLVTLVKKFSDFLKRQDWDDRIDHASTWIEAIRLRDFVGGVLDSNLYYDKDGNRVSADKVLPWRGIPTSGPFCHGGKFPVIQIWNKGRRTYRYVTKTLEARGADNEYSRLFWMPTERKVSWKRWYMDNRNMHGRDRDYFIHADTWDDAKELAKLIGFDKPVEDGTTLHTVAKSARKKGTGEPSPYKGMAWINARGPWALDEFEPWQLILSTVENHHDLYTEVNTVNNLRLTEKPLVVFRPWGVPESVAVKRYPDSPRSVREWLDANEHRLDTDKILERRKLNDIHGKWKSEWICIHRASDTPKHLDFPGRHVGLLTLPSELSALVDDTYLGVEPEIEAIDQWHKNVFENLPQEVKSALNNQWTFTHTEVLNLFSTLSTLEV